MVTFLQIVSQYCGGTINPPWPDLYTKVGQKFEVINLNFVSLAAATCGIKPDYSWKLWGMVCTPVLGMIGIGAFYAVSLARLKIAHEFEAREHDEARRRRQEARRGNRESPSESPSSGEGAPATAEDATDAAEPASYCVDTGLVQPASAPSTTPRPMRGFVKLPPPKLCSTPMQGAAQLMSWWVRGVAGPLCGAG